MPSQQAVGNTGHAPWPLSAVTPGVLSRNRLGRVVTLLNRGTPHPSPALNPDTAPHSSACPRLGVAHMPDPQPDPTAGRLLQEGQDVTGHRQLLPIRGRRARVQMGPESGDEVGETKVQRFKLSDLSKTIPCSSWQCCLREKSLSPAPTAPQGGSLSLGFVFRGSKAETTPFPPGVRVTLRRLLKSAPPLALLCTPLRFKPNGCGACVCT